MTIYTSGEAVSAETGNVLAQKFLFMHDFEFQTSTLFDKQRLIIPYDCTLEEIHAEFLIAPTGADAIFNVRVNGVLIFSGAGRPTVAAGTTTLNKIGIGYALQDGDYIEWEDVQKGSTTAGGYGAIVLVFK